MNKLAMKFNFFIAKVFLPFVNMYISLGDKKRNLLNNNEADEIVSSAKVIITVIGGKPYYGIEYFDLKDKEWHLGYSSYKLRNVIEWRKECFKVVQGEIF